jgi:chorismate mutase
MQKEKIKTYYLVNKDILPEAILKTVMVKDILAKGEALTVNEAVERVGLSRSAFYKYRDGIFPFNKTCKEKIISVSFILEHKPGVLSNVLNTVARMKGNILTINQGIPLQSIAQATLSIDTSGVKEDLEKLVNKLYHVPGVKKVEIVGQS